MSRRAAAALALMSIAPLPLHAQVPETAEAALENAAQVYGPPPPEKMCPTARQGEEIVVCAEQQEQSQFRVRSDGQAEDDYARATMDKGAPRAPDVAGPGIFKGPPTISGICGIGLNRCPPPPLYIVDFAALPPTPPGSDAERVGQGLAPLGSDAAPEPAESVSSPGAASPAEPQSGSRSLRAAPAPR